jgi:protein TilB
MNQIDMSWICKFTSKLYDLRFAIIENLITFRFLDTSLIDVDVQPNYVRVTIKDKIFQMALNDEVQIDASTSKRSQITGHLLIVMPKLRASINFPAETSSKIITKSSDKLKEAVNIRNIVIDESEVPPLI